MCERGCFLMLRLLLTTRGRKSVAAKLCLPRKNVTLFLSPQTVLEEKSSLRASKKRFRCLSIKAAAAAAVVVVTGVDICVRVVLFLVSMYSESVRII